MKKLDYFFTSLILTVTLIVFCSALLIAEFNSARYISASIPRLVEVKVASPLKGEVTFLGETGAWDLSSYEEEIGYVKKAAVILPRGARVVGNTVSIIYEEIKNFFESMVE